LSVSAGLDPSFARTHAGVGVVAKVVATEVVQIARGPRYAPRQASNCAASRGVGQPIPRLETV